MQILTSTVTYRTAQNAYEQNCFFFFETKLFKASVENINGLDLGFALDPAGFPSDVPADKLSALKDAMILTLKAASDNYLASLAQINASLQVQVGTAITAFEEKVNDECVE